jgi:SulP family sulfate permease
MLGNALTVVFDPDGGAAVVGLLGWPRVLFVRRMSSLFQVGAVEQRRGSLLPAARLAGFFGAVAKIDPILNVVESAVPGK